MSSALESATDVTIFGGMRWAPSQSVARSPEVADAFREYFKRKYASMIVRMREAAAVRSERFGGEADPVAKMLEGNANHLVGAMMRFAA